MLSNSDHTTDQNTDSDVIVDKRRDIAIEISNIFDNNKLSDLNRFLSKRQCLNNTNGYLIYLFHLVQSAGILTTAIAAGTENTDLVWIGVGLNITASLINVYEKLNNTISSKLLHDIKLIKTNNYVDESELIDSSNQNIKETQTK